jgi:hypothetical protein
MRHVSPDETARGMPGRLISVQLQDEWPLATSGHVAQQSMALRINMQKLQRGRGLSLSSRWTCQLVLGNTDIVQQLQTRRNGSNMECRLVVESRLAAIQSGVVRTAIQSSVVGTAIRSNGVGRWPGQCVGHSVVQTRHVANISCKFCHVGQLLTLHGLPSISNLAQCIGEWLIFCVDGKWLPF